MQIPERAFMGPATNTCHLFITELTFRDSSVLDGPRLILGSLLRAIVLIRKKHFFVLWRFLKLSYLLSYKYQALNGWRGRGLFLSFY